MCQLAYAINDKLPVWYTTEICNNVLETQLKHFYSTWLKLILSPLTVW